MSHQVVYRKYRSQDFSELIGQEHIAKTLSNQILTNSVGHAYLFFGPRGTGKTSTARIFAKSVNCINPNNDDGFLLPCGKCESCLSFNSDDVDILEMDAASNRGIDDARLLKDKVYSQPLMHKYKIIILDEAHMLTREAVNALLKIIEEPPEYVIFIFCTTEFNKIPITIASRCQRFKFMLAKEEDLVKKLTRICKEEGKELPEDKIKVIAKLAKGSFRDSESLLEQVLFSNSDNFLSDLFNLYLDNSTTDKLFEIIKNKDSEGLWNLLCEIEDSQGDIRQLFDALLMRTKELYKQNKIKFDDYLTVIRLGGSIRLGTKEEILYKFTNMYMISSSLPSHSAQQIHSSASTNKVETKPVNLQSKSTASQTVVSSVPASPENKTSEINRNTILDLFRGNSGLFNMIEKATISFSENIVKIEVVSTVSKLYLMKNNVKGTIIKNFDKVKDVLVETVANRNSAEKQPEKKVDEKPKMKDNMDQNLDSAEEIFGAKFQ